MDWNIVVMALDALVYGAGVAAVVLGVVLLAGCKTDIFERIAIKSFYRGYNNEAKRDKAFGKLSTHAQMLFMDLRKYDDGKVPYALSIAVNEWCEKYATELEKLVLNHEMEQAEKRKMQSQIMSLSVQGWKHDDSVEFKMHSGSMSARIVHNPNAMSTGNLVGGLNQNVSNHALRNQLQVQYMHEELERMKKRYDNISMLDELKKKIKAL